MFNFLHKYILKSNTLENTLRLDSLDVMVLYLEFIYAVSISIMDLTKSSYFTVMLCSL